MGVQFLIVVHTRMHEEAPLIIGCTDKRHMCQASNATK